MESRMLYIVYYKDNDWEVEKEDQYKVKVFQKYSGFVANIEAELQEQVLRFVAEVGNHLEYEKIIKLDEYGRITHFEVTFDKKLKLIPIPEKK